MGIVIEAIIMNANTYVLLALVGWLSISLAFGWEELYVNNGLDRGEWGDVEKCMDGTSTFAFDFKFEETGKLDNTCGNGVMMLCHDGDGQMSGHITSTEGNFGEWLGTRNCPLGANITGFRLRVLPNQGTWGDDQGVDNIQMQCSDGTILDGIQGIISPEEQDQESQKVNNDEVHEKVYVNGEEIDIVYAETLSGDENIYGDWGDWALCSSGSVMGIMTQVEQGHPLEDDAGLCNVVMYCE